MTLYTNMDLRRQPLKRWPFWKKFLLVVLCFAVLGLADGITEGAVWIIEQWRTP